ncbi:hypothetical protein Sjap_015376 [Stephania japonica]|uniref:Auxin transport protein BIG n=1 Tax=Stephania japonica TaxID=461633 RepID=A0AAP0IJ10_9MAGN
MALVDGVDKEFDPLKSCSFDTIVEMLPIIESKLDSEELNNYLKCSQKGRHCVKERKPVEWILMALASESLQPDTQTSTSIDFLRQNLSNMIAMSQHWAVVHIKFVHRLVMLCKVLFSCPKYFDSQAETGNSNTMLYLSLRILKLIGNLTAGASYVACDAELLEALASCADALPQLFKRNFDFARYLSTAAENSSENLVPLLLEEFLHVVQYIFCDGIILRNVQTCIVASMIDLLDGDIWRYGRSISELNPPLVYFPRSTNCIMKLIKDAKRSRPQSLTWQEKAYIDCFSSGSGTFCGPYCRVRLEKVFLLQEYTCDELLKVIFPSTSLWVDNLIHLVFFLHSEGVKLKPSIERSLSICGKGVNASDLDGGVGHEDEALFGDLFCEAGRTVGSTDELDQHSVSFNFSQNFYHLPTQAATELLIFLKSCIFSPEWHSSVYEDACKKLSKNGIDFLLAILNCSACSTEEQNSEIIASSSQRKFAHINEVCFELLHSLLVNHALIDLLEEHIADRILNVEDGVFVYNNHTLSLLAFALVCKVGLAGSSLRTTILRKYVNFIIEKLKQLSLTSQSLKELLRTLPCTLHVKIVLMAFHLSSETEKESFANFMFSSIRTTDAPMSSSTQLSFWGLLISRLILVLRHIIFYPSTCPSWLLLDLRSKLRESPFTGPYIPGYLNDHLLSWPATAVENLMGELVKEEPAISSLLCQLIDFAAFPAFVTCNDNPALQQLWLNWDDVRACFSWVLGFWRGRKAQEIVDLIVERYMFTLCWDVPTMNSTFSHMISSLSGFQTLDTLNMECYFHFRHLLLQSSVVIKDADFSQVIVSMLKHLQSLLISSITKLGWDFLRAGSWLSLVLSLIHAGLSRFCAKNMIPGVDLLWTVCSSRDSEYLALAEAVVGTVFQGNDLTWLFNMLSSLLERYLRAYNDAFLNSYDHGKSYADKFSPLLLLKHTEFDKLAQSEVVQNDGIILSELESAYSLLSKLDGIVARSVSGHVDRVFLSSLLHGFPSHPSTPSGVVVSSALVVRLIVYVLFALVKIKDARGFIYGETEIASQLFDSLMAIKSDRLFECIHGKCEAICHSLSTDKKNMNYSYLYVLKHMEGFIKDINCRGTHANKTHEILVTRTVDVMEGLMKDPLKAGIFKFYLGASEDMPDELKKVYGGLRGNLLVLFDALDGCYSETVNIKVLSYFVELLSGERFLGLKQEFQKRFLGINLVSLSKWLERRLLGYAVEDSSVLTTARGSSTLLRESTMNFIFRVLSPPCELDLNIHLVEAMLMSLDSAFMLYDIHTSKAYFHFIVQLCNGQSSMKQLLNRTITLMEKLAGDESKLQGLRFLFGFLATVLSDCGANKNISEKFSKYLSSNSLGSGPLESRAVSSRKSADALLIPANREKGSASIDCDATSMDDDEDDGTSDGELASVDKDDEDDSNSERALASKVCTFTSSGSNFMEQHWYFCYTCDLTVSKGCCSVCAKVCHRGHRVVYSRLSRFFCDCGAGGVRGCSCQCLKPRELSANVAAPVCASSNFQPFLPFTDDGCQVPDSDSDLDDDVFVDGDAFKLSISREVKEGILAILEDLDIEGRVLKLCNSLLPAVIRRRDSYLSKDKKVLLGEAKVLQSADLLQLKKAYKSGSLDLKIKSDYSNSRELKSLLASGSIIKSLLSVSTRGKLAAGEGEKVSIFDVGQLIGQATVAAVAADKANIKPLSKNAVRFEVVHIVFNPVVENYLAVAGYEECQVLTVNHRGEVTDRLPIELALQGAYIRRIEWVPATQVQLMVVTNLFVKIYDLSQDNISPMHYVTLPDDFIVDATLVLAAQGKLFLLVLSNLGCLFRLELSTQGDIGAKMLKDVIQVQDNDKQSKGSSLYFSSAYRILFVSYQDGTTLIGRLDATATSLTEISAVYEDEQDSRLRPAGLHHWKDLLAGSGLFVCCSSVKSNSVLAVSLDCDELVSQNMRHVAGSALPLVGITAYRPLSKDKTDFLVLHDDGSLQIYSLFPTGVDSRVSATYDRAKKLGTNILSNKAYSGLNPEFPLDFFEKTVCITADVKLSGDAIRNSDSEGTKQTLASDDGYLESPSTTGFKITVANSNPDIVMVGFRLHVGNTSGSHIPSEIAVFQRVIKLDEGMRSWYDIPFTTAECLLADEEFTISVGPTFSGSTLPRIDSLEIYGRAKDEFGWKEKMDAILDMEAHVLGSASGAAGTGKKYPYAHSAPIQEQVIADGLKLLSRFYSLQCSHGCSVIEEAQMELNKLNCKKLLGTIFESDREPLLQSAACHVLQAVFPKRDVKDTMRLLGIVKSSPVLASRLGIGGSAAGWVVEEFTAQMHAVSKIAMSRRSNLASFLETHGSAVVDGLMQVLWGILDIEQPDTQTINNIVIPSVEVIYSYAECLSLHGNDSGMHSVAPAVTLLKKLLFAPYESVQTSSSLALSSRLLQVPFPKQTMLAADDVVENAPCVPAASDIHGTTGGMTQVMIEEDSATSSVQYCCDGCSTVPILRRRWHCTVCPDFDLCEACYELLDTERLPPPHSRDHPMSAIPIELESLGGDGNDIHFSMDDLSDASLLPVPTDISRQNSPSIHILEPSESGEFPVTVNDQTIVAISASKRAVNSLLLSELVEQLKGWMETTTGSRAIPLMQLFYRLSSAVGGPFMDSSKSEKLDLEKFVRWFLAEMNLNRPFVANNRSSFGEVSILVFMFFTLMLRNWNQPSSDSSLPKSNGVTDGVTDTQDRNVQIRPSNSSGGPSVFDDQVKSEFASQLLRACCSLRQQNFVNYLMDILQQLVHLFKSSSVNHEATNSSSGCGALLTVRRELPAGNFFPFFSDSYAKAHRADIFIDYHRLLLENTFRLVYSLVRPEKQEKSGEKEKMYRTSSGNDLKLDGYQDVLCSYISNPHTTFVRRYARRLFLHLCGSKSHYYNVRDSWQLTMEVKRLFKIVNKSGGFKKPTSYERSVKLVKCLSSISEVASARPRNWQKYCSRHGEVLHFLMNGIFYFGEESVIQTLKLLNLAFYTGKDLGHHSIQKADAGDAGTNAIKSSSLSLESKKKKKNDDATDSSVEKSYLDMEQPVDIFNDKDGTVLKQFIDCFLLEWNSTPVRVEAKCVLYGIWHHSKKSFREVILLALLEKVKLLPMYGQNVIEFTELVAWLLGKIPDGCSKQQDLELVGRCLTPDVIRCIFETLHSQNELLANHPNSRIYTTLSGLVEFDGYYLESEPCVACSCPEVPYGRLKLESLKSETKFTDNRIIVKCTGSYMIQTVTMNVHDARKSKSVKVLNLYYNNRPVADLSELKNNWSLWKRAKSCHLAFNQTELKVEFPIPITACNFMIELDSFYENLQASSLESLQCPRCSRAVTDKHGICSNCHENAYQCRQCRNINYENLDSFLCNECGYCKYGRFEFNFMAKPSFSFDSMENDEDMKKGLAAIESESENAHRRYQQLLGFKKPLLKLVSSIGENEMDSQQKDSVQQMMVSLPGPSCKINRKIALLGVLYGEKCKAAFDSVSKSVQTLQGLRRVLMKYLHQTHSDNSVASSRFAVSRSPNNCYGCATTFITQCLELLLVLSKYPNSKKQLVAAGILPELFENNIHQGPKNARVQARAVLCSFSEGDLNAVSELNSLIQKKVMYCLEHHRSMDIALATREELLLLSETCSMADEFWESRLRVAFQLLFSSIKLGAKHPAISEHVILPCLRIICQACTPPKPEATDKDQAIGKSSLASQFKDETKANPSASLSVPVSGSKPAAELSEKQWDGPQKVQDIQLVSYSEWEKGASYLDFVRRRYKVSQAVKSTTQRSRPQRVDYLTLKYALRWRRCACRRTAKSELSAFELGFWVSELILTACSQSIRSEMCTLISLLCAQSSSRRFRLINLLMELLPATLSAGESASEYFELLFKMVDSEDARLFLTARGCLTTICTLITQEVSNIESQERSLRIDISQGFILHKLIELLSKFLEVSNIRSRFMRNDLLSQVLEALIVIRGLIVQKTKLINDCNRLLKELFDSLLLESSENKRQFIRACISGLQIHGEERKERTSLFILEQLCNLICPSKPEPSYLLVLNKAHTQEEFIRGSMTKNPYSSAEIGFLMRDVKNKICHQLELLGLLEDDYGMELLVAGNIISLDLSISQVYEQVWKKSCNQSGSTANSALLSSGGFTAVRDCPPMTVTYRLQGLDGEATEPMIKELEEEREETQDPEVEFAIAGAVREYGGLEIILSMIQAN